MIRRILRGPRNTVRGAPALLPELRAIVDSCATGDQGASLDKQVRYGPGPRLGDLTLAALCQRLNPLRPRYPGTSFILRYEAKLPSGRSPGFAMWGKSRLRVSIPGWAGGESPYLGGRVVRLPEAWGSIPAGGSLLAELVAVLSLRERAGNGSCGEA